MPGNTAENNRQFVMVIDRGPSGYCGFCPQLRGSYTLGQTYDETLQNLKNNVRLYLAARAGRGAPIPRPEFIPMSWDDLLRM